MSHILSAVERVLAEQRQAPCYCHAYEFPHRVGGGRCCAVLPVPQGRLHYRGNERDDDLRLFDREEAQAINEQRERLNVLAEAVILAACEQFDAKGGE